MFLPEPRSKDPPGAPLPNTSHITLTSEHRLPRLSNYKLSAVGDILQVLDTL